MRLSLPAAAVAAVLATVLALPAAAQSPSRSNFEARTVADLAALCGASPQAADYAIAAAFCHGFLQGAGQYHASITQPGSGNRPVFCVPDPAPTRAQAADQFVAWAARHPDLASQRAVDGLARWAHETYPCAPRGAAR